MFYIVLYFKEINIIYPQHKRDFNDMSIYTYIYEHAYAYWVGKRTPSLLLLKLMVTTLIVQKDTLTGHFNQINDLYRSGRCEHIIHKSLY